MKRRLQIAVSVSAVSIALLISAFTAFSQQRGAPVAPGAPAPAAGPGAAAGRGAPGGGQGAPGGQGGGQRGATLPGTESGWSLFQQRCAICHLNPAVDLAIPGTVIREMTPERIFASLTTGSMAAKSEGIND